MIGKTISHYKILEKLGEGGMGVVYKAEDTDLKRTVALKFLSQQALGSEQEKSRFIHEAQSAASLDHPSICTVHEINKTEEHTFIAMAYVEGQTLRSKIESGPLKLDEAMDVAVQIAEGLKEAHEKGVVHRDIKPANIMITPKGQVKIMDFGLAKAPGWTRLTRTGMTLGTAAYMSPEQARGGGTDHRTDIWSLGVILYEMIVGRLPFKGEYEPAVVYSILNEEPEPLTALRTGVPVELERIVAKLLAKDPRARYQHVDELPVDLRAVDVSSTDTSTLSPVTSREKAARRVYRGHRTLTWSTVSVLMIAAAVAGGYAVKLFVQAPASQKRFPARFVMVFPETAPLHPEPMASLSPDGRRLVYLANVGGVRQLGLRELDRLESRVLPGTDDAYSPFFSPDGQWVGFFAGGELKKLYLGGGKPITLCSALDGMGGSWGADDTIYFCPTASEGLWRIPAGGGDPIRLTTPDQKEGELGHWWPQVLPGGEAVLFTVWSTTINDSQVALLLRKTGERRALITGASFARYSSTGHLLYAQSGALVAAPFDLKRLEIRDPRILVLEDLRHRTGNGYAFYSFSHNGLLCYSAGSEWSAKRRLVWTDRQGKVFPLPLPPGAYWEASLSPDGRRLAFTKFEGGFQNIWVHEFASGTTRQYTFDRDNFSPVWTPDGAWLTFTSGRLGPYSVFQMPVDRSARERPFLTGPADQFAGSWSPDGKWFLYSVNDQNTGRDIWYVSDEDRDNRHALLKETFYETQPVFHPTGKWFAYASNESGRYEVSVRPFPGPGAVTPISTNGGSYPLWSRDGRELFYRSFDGIMVVDVQTEPRLSAGSPRVLLEGEQLGPHDVSPDGRFVMVENPQDEVSNRLIIVFNWFDELNRLCPSGN